MNGSVYNNEAILNFTDESLGVVEKTPTASKAHPVGSYFVYNNQFLKVISAIAQGGTINIGTNCVVDNIGAVLYSLNAEKQDATNYTSSQINSYLSMIAANPSSIGFMSSRFAIEDTEYPGCWYRMNGNVKEWWNPPLMPGVDYRLVERCNNSPVVIRVFNDIFNGEPGPDAGETKAVELDVPISSYVLSYMAVTKENGTKFARWSPTYSDTPGQDVKDHVYISRSSIEGKLIAHAYTTVDRRNYTYNIVLKYSI